MPGISATASGQEASGSGSRFRDPHEGRSSRAVTACPAAMAMFFAAFTSALQANLQAVHRKTAWLSRDFPSTCPQALQRWLVYMGVTFYLGPFVRAVSPASPNLRRGSPDSVLLSAAH